MTEERVGDYCFDCGHHVMDHAGDGCVYRWDNGNLVGSVRCACRLAHTEARRNWPTRRAHR